MILLGSKRKHSLYWVLVFLAVVFVNARILASIRLSLDSIFSGLLALTGFVFTARTFITFKLHEVVYGNPTYRTYVEKLKKDGASDKRLYDPLRELDSSLGNATGMCLVALALFALVAFLPDHKDITLDASTKVSRLYDIIRSGHNVKLAVNNPGALVPVGVALVSDMALIYFFFVLNQILSATISLNKNIKAIIDHWEQDYKNSQQKK